MIDDLVQLWIASAGVAVMPITPAIAALAVEFPQGYLRDPADQLIGATARAEDLAELPRDRQIRAISLLKTIW